MALVRWIFLFTILISAGTFAQDYSEDDRGVLKQAVGYYEKKDFKNGLLFLEKKFNLSRTKDAPATVYRLAYMFCNRLGDRDGALKYKYLTISKEFPDLHKKVMENYDRTKTVEMDVPEKLLAHYYALAKSFSELYLDEEKNTEVLALKYWSILSEKEYKEDEADKMIERINQEKDLRLKKDFKWQFFASAGLISWQEEIVANDTSSGKHTLFATVRGTCIGGGARYANYFREWNLEGCFINAAANIGPKESSLTYSQSNVPVTGMMGQIGHSWKFSDGRASIGPAFPIMYRTGQFEDTSALTLKGKSTISIGAMIQARWSFSKVSLVMDIGKLSTINIFKASLQYQF